MLHLLPRLLMRKRRVKTVVPSNIFPVLGEFGFLVGARTLWPRAFGRPRMACPYYHFSRPVTNRCDKLF